MGARVAKLAKVNATHNNEAVTTHHILNIQDRRPSHLGPISPLKFNITNRLAAHRYDKNFNFTRHDAHLMFSSNNTTNTSVVMGRRGVAGKGSGIAPRNHTNTVVVLGKT